MKNSQNVSLSDGLKIDILGFMRNYTLFFSWQNEVKESKKIIFDALYKAKEKLKDRDIEITIDQDTRKRTGIRKIDVEIIEKINKCDIFLCDLSPVTTKTPKKKTDLKRHMPNSNVMFEFGYAMGVLGQDNIIALAKFRRGEHIELMPFDIKTFTITDFKKTDDLKYLDKWIENICDEVDKKKSAMVHEYDLKLGIISGNEASLKGAICPIYKRNVNHHSVDRNIETKEDIEDSMAIATGRGLDVLIRRVQMEAAIPAEEIKVITHEIYRSFCPIEILVCNLGEKALENVSIFIEANNPEVRFKYSNEEDTLFHMGHIIDPDGIQVKDKDVRMKYEILNPQTQYKLKTFFVFAPPGVDSFNLRWSASTKTGRFNGEIEVLVVPDYHQTETWINNRPDGEETIEEYIESITKD